jgi:hypothetical protein
VSMIAERITIISQPDKRMNGGENYNFKKLVLELFLGVYRTKL